MSVDLRTLTFELDLTELNNLVDAIKLRRAQLRHHSDSAFVYFHRKLQIEHEDSRSCWCDPVVITQHDWQPSAYFAHKILYPTVD